MHQACIKRKGTLVTVVRRQTQLMPAFGRLHHHLHHLSSPTSLYSGRLDNHLRTSRWKHIVRNCPNLLHLTLSINHSPIPDRSQGQPVYTSKGLVRDWLRNRGSGRAYWRSQDESADKEQERDIGGETHCLSLRVGLNDNNED